MSHRALSLSIVENTWAGGEGEWRLEQVVKMGENVTPAHPKLQVMALWGWRGERPRQGRYSI